MAVLRELLLQDLQLVSILAHCALTGFALNARLGLFDATDAPRNNVFLRTFFAFASGLAVDITVLFGLGMTGMLTHHAVVAAGVLLAIVAVASLARTHLLMRGRAPNVASRPARVVALEWLAIGLLFLLLSAKSVKAPGLWDDTSFHLPIARFYTEHHSFALAQYLRFPLFPQNGELLLVLGLMTGGDVLAQGLATMPLFVICVGFVGASLWSMRSSFPGFLMVLVMLALGPVTETLGYAFIDNALALFCWAALLAVALWSETGERRTGWLVAAGLFAGIACGTKFFGGVFVVFIGAWIVLVARNWRGALIFALATLVFGLGWYLRSAAISGDPFSPAGAKVFGYYLWNAGDLAGQVSEQGAWGVKKNLFYLWPALKKAKIIPWVLALISLLFFRRQTRAVRFFQLVFIGYFLFWFFVTQVGRYLAPIYALGSYLAVWFVFAGHRYAAKMNLQKASVLLALIPCLALASAAAFATLAATRNVAHWNDTLDSRNGYALRQKANALMPQYGSNLLALGYEDSAYFFNGTSIGDWFGPGRYRDMLDCAKSCTLIAPAAMAAKMAQFHSNMLMINPHRLNLDDSSLAPYRAYFQVQAEDASGILLTRRPSPGH